MRRFLITGLFKGARVMSVFSSPESSITRASRLRRVWKMRWILGAGESLVLSVTIALGDPYVQNGK